MRFTRRPLVLLLAALPLAVRSQAAPASLVLPDIELLDTQPDPNQAADHARRIQNTSRQLREGLAQAGLYRIIDPTTVQSTIDEQRAAHATIFDCNGCAQAIGQAARSDLVAMAWVQKVSQLILNLNVEVRETATDRVVLNKSVDMRGNNDESWARAARFMLRDWAEKRAARPRYGLP
jgi:hypothetical protein